MDLNQLKKKRTSFRIAFTKALNSLNVLLENTTSGTADLTVAYMLVADKHKQLEEIATRVVDKLTLEETDEVIIQKELDEHDAYKSNYLMAKFQFDSRITARSSRAQSVSPVNSDTIGRQTESRKTRNLPKMELAKFSGNVREWLQF